MDRVEFQPLFAPAAVSLALAGLGALAVLAAWRTRRTWPVWANLCALGLRAIAFACAALLILRPTSVQRIVSERPHALALLVDASQSLARRDGPDAPTRAEQGDALLAALRESALARGWTTFAADAGSNLEARHPDDASVHPRAGASALGEALDAWATRATDEGDGRPPGAVVLFSDGVVNSGRPLAVGVLPWARLGVPIYAVTLGQVRSPAPDAALFELNVRPEGDSGDSSELAQAAPRGGQRLRAEARANLVAGGLDLSGPLADANARLWIGGPLGAAEAGPWVAAESMRHRLRSAPAWTTVRLHVTPRQPGHYRLRMALDPLHGEERTLNNIAYAEVDVRPPERRVALVASRLGHDYRALRAALARAGGPRVLAIPDFARPEAGSDGLAPPWPVEDLARAWLDEGVPAASRAGTWVWLEPDPRHLSERQQAKLRVALEQGELGLIWVCNEPAAEVAARFKGTPLEDALLFREWAAPADGSASARRPEPVRGTEAARAHELTAWAYAQGGEPWRAWGATWAWDGFSRPRDGTSVLLQTGARPLLSIGRVGHGRVALLACGESWRWLTPAPGDPERTGSVALAETFWSKLVSWAAGADRGAEPAVRLYLARQHWNLGEPLQARVGVRLPEGVSSARVEFALLPAPAPEAPLPPLAWRALGNVERGIGAAADRERFVAGVLDAAAPIERAGEYLLVARALAPDDSEIGRDRMGLIVEGAPLEAQVRGPDTAALEAAVRAGSPGSRLVPPTPEGIAALVEELAAGPLKPEVVEREERAPVVNPQLLLGLLLAALLVDYWLRRG